MLNADKIRWYEIKPARNERSGGLDTLKSQHHQTPGLKDSGGFLSPKIKC